MSSFEYNALMRIAQATERAQKVAEYALLFELQGTAHPMYLRYKALREELWPEHNDVVESYGSTR